VFDAFGKYGSLEKENPYLDRVFDANQLIFEEVLAMTSVAVRNIILKQFEKDGTLDRFINEGQEKWLEKGQEKAKRETALEMLGDGFTPDKVARYVKMPLEWVQGLAR